MRKRGDIVEVLGTRRCKVTVHDSGRANGPGKPRTSQQQQGVRNRTKSVSTVVGLWPAQLQRGMYAVGEEKVEFVHLLLL